MSENFKADGFLDANDVLKLDAILKRFPKETQQVMFKIYHAAVSGTPTKEIEAMALILPMEARAALDEMAQITVERARAHCAQEKRKEKDSQIRETALRILEAMISRCEAPANNDIEMVERSLQMAQRLHDMTD